jgi:glycosyltransferase involved in cell wall biosynthesis
VSSQDTDAISVVISTFERPEACERALRSVLAQTEPPLEVLVCDNGSTDQTESIMRAWEHREERVRYLRTARNTGTPGTTRNLGIEHARGALIAFLDDDDEWLPGKLAAQQAAFVNEGGDVVATNGLQSDGSVYLADMPRVWRPTRAELLRANPIIVSSALVPRERLVSVGGFQTSPKVRGIEDYAMWLALTRSGGGIVIIGEPLVRYDNASPDRMSMARARTQLSVARLAWTDVLRLPVKAAGLRAAFRHTLGTVHVAIVDGLGALRARRKRSVPGV